MACLPLDMRPETLIPGKTYRLYAPPWTATGAEPVFHPVQFVAYDPCPAMAIVRNGAGRQRVPRCDLRLPDGAPPP